MGLRDVQIIVAMVTLLGLFDYLLVFYVRETGRSIKEHLRAILIVNILPAAYIVGFILRAKG